MSEPQVLSRDRNGRPVLWRCSDCGEPFNLGWGARCNKCIKSDERHQEIIAALGRLATLKQEHDQEADHTNKAIIDAKMVQP